MNILIINHEFPPVGGGASNASWFLASSLQEKGNKVTVLTSTFKDFKTHEMVAGFEIYRIPSLRRFKDRSNILEMFSFVLSGIFHSSDFIKKRKIDGIISFFSIPAGIISLYLYKKYKIPYVVSLRGGDVPGLVPELTLIHRFLSPLRRAILRNAKSIVANSVTLKNLSEQVDPFKVKVIANGVDSAFFRPSKKKNKNIFRFIFVGRLNTQKNLFFLLEQILILKKEIKKDFVLEIVGDGPLEGELKRYSKEIGIDNVFWRNWLNKPALLERYQNSDCLLMPTLYEGMSNVILEGMACGLPIVASDISANRFIIKNGQNGLLFRINNSSDFQNILKLLIIDSKKREILGERARKYVTKKFSWDSIAKKYLALFNVIE